MSNILQIESVTKKFGELIAVNNVSLTIKSGTVFALIGPNGSGKTTLLNCIVGLLSPDAGEILISGVDIQKKPVVAKHLFSYISDNPSIYPYLSGLEFIRLTARLHQLGDSAMENKISELKKIFPIEEILESRTESYSRGNMEKTAFLAALISSPKLLIVDEPIVGLDTASIEILGDTLRKYVKNGGTVFMSTHTLSFVKRFADMAAIIHEGKLIKEIPIKPKTDLEKIYHLETS